MSPKPGQDPASLASIGESPDESLCITGALSFDTTGDTLLKSQSWLRAGRVQQIDLGGVTRADSAGLALIVEWVKEARQRGGDVKFINVPQQLLALATACGLKALFAT